MNEEIHITVNTEGEEPTQYTAADCRGGGEGCIVWCAIASVAIFIAVIIWRLGDLIFS